MKGGFYMQTELQFSIIYPSHAENDINKFDFFIRMMPTGGKNIISVLAVPKFSVDGRVVKHLHFCVQSEHSLKSQNILMVISQLIRNKRIFENKKV